MMDTECVIRLEVDDGCDRVNFESFVVNVVATADLSLTKTVSNAIPDRGENITYRITLINDGPDDATNVTVEDQHPSGVTYVSSSASMGTYNAMTGIWTVGTVSAAPPDTVETLEIVVTVANPVVGPNYAQVVTSDQFGNYPRHSRRCVWSEFFHRLGYFGDLGMHHFQRIL